MIKKIIFFIFLIFVMDNTYSKVNSGDIITATKINESLLSLGSVQKSLLTEEEFQSLQGTCWVKMKGQCISSECEISSGVNGVQSDLAEITKDSSNKITYLPDSSGRFLRDTGGYAEPLGKVQDDAIRNITGEIKTNDTNEYVFGEENVKGSGAFEMLSNISQYNPSKSEDTYSISAGFKFDAGNVVPVAEENRPKNLTVNMFIKINHDCN